tara:strand:+ start:1433 stop:1960 length:528 start_codon:yes stop_codon:yes gene_type:complete
MTIRDINIVNLEDDEMGHVTSGCLRVKSNLHQAVVLDSRNSDSSMPILVMKTDTGAGVRMNLRLDVPGGELCGKLFAAVCICDDCEEEELEEIEKYDWNSRGMAGLLMTPTGRVKGEYKRVGMFEQANCDKDNYKLIIRWFRRADAQAGAVGANIAKEFYKEYHEDVDQYTFTIV